jgi:type IV pilus assembly protein PilA
MLSRMKKRFTKGFTLIELMIVVAIIGVLAAVAIPAFMKYIRKSKTTEAVENVKKIYEGARSYYMEESNSRGSITPIAKQFPLGDAGASAGPSPGANSCCGAAGDKCDPNIDRTIWDTDGWNALKFSMDDPHYFWYSYDADGTDVASQFTARANGNLDCDGVYSTYEMVGRVNSLDRTVSGSAGFYKNQELE